MSKKTFKKKNNKKKNTKKKNKKQNTNKQLFDNFKSINNYLSSNIHKGDLESYVKYYDRFTNGENVFTYFYVLKKIGAPIVNNLCLPDNKLYYDYNNHKFSDKPMNRNYSIYHLTIFLIYDKKEIIAPFNFKKSIDNCKKRFVLISCNVQWGINKWTGAHQTILLFDNKNKTVELYDPEFSNLDYIEYDDTMKKFINKIFKKKYEYIGTHYTTHPEKKHGPQVSVDEYSGLCTAWSIMYVQLRLLNPNMKPSYIVKKMMEGNYKLRKNILLKFTKNIKSLIKNNLDVITTEII